MIARWMLLIYEKAKQSSTKACGKHLIRIKYLAAWFHLFLINQKTNICLDKFLFPPIFTAKILTNFTDVLVKRDAWYLCCHVLLKPDCSDRGMMNTAWKIDSSEVRLLVLMINYYQLIQHARTFSSRTFSLVIKESSGIRTVDIVGSKCLLVLKCCQLGHKRVLPSVSEDGTQKVEFKQKI